MCGVGPNATRRPALTRRVPFRACPPPPAVDARAPRSHCGLPETCYSAKLSDNNLDAILAPTDSPGWTTDRLLSDHFLFASSGLAGGPGYPIVQIPAGNMHGMPMGISFLGTAFSEPTLIRLASGFEAVTHARIQPTFVGNITTEHTGHSTATEPQPPDRDDGRRPHRL